MPFTKINTHLEQNAKHEDSTSLSKTSVLNANKHP